jgi:hypothetical protein
MFFIQPSMGTMFCATLIHGPVHLHGKLKGCDYGYNVMQYPSWHLALYYALTAIVSVAFTGIELKEILIRGLKAIIMFVAAAQLCVAKKTVYCNMIW